MFHSLLSFMMLPFPGFCIATGFYDLAVIRPICSLAFINKKPERVLYVGSVFVIKQLNQPSKAVLLKEESMFS